MSIALLRDRLRIAREDDRVTLAEVEAFIRGAMADGSVNFQEALLLGAELEANGRLFDPDAREALKGFLEQHQPQR